MRKTFALNLDEEKFIEFQKFCTENDIVVSRKVDTLVDEFLKKEKSIDSIVDDYDVKSVNSAIHKHISDMRELENNYIGFSFHDDAEHNLKILNLLEKVIPEIDDFIAHKGLISIIIDGKEKEFGTIFGESSPEIVEWLVKLKFMDKEEYQEELNSLGNSIHEIR